MHKPLLINIVMLCIVSHVALAKGYFIQQGDMCDQNLSKQCINDPQAVKSLQQLLNRDKVLHVSLQVDGKWGKQTKQAVISFQKTYAISPADGWVGVRTKKMLDKVAKRLHYKIEPTKKNVRMLAKKEGSYFTDTYEVFRKRINLRKSYAVYQNRSLLRKANRKNTRLVVDISEQRIRMYVGKKVALDAPCTTGSKRKLEPNTKRIRDKRTPVGRFRITEKIADKRSTIFGDYYKNGKRIYHGDRRMYRGPRKGVRFVGASLQYWMRLTSSGIGLHASKYVKRYPATNGCIRLPKKVAKTIFHKVRKGTPVTIQY